MRKNTAAEFHRKYGPWAVVTGASAGIGRAMAEAIAATGIHLVIVARRNQELVGLANQLTEKYRVQVQVIAVDLSEATAMDEVIAATGGLEVGLLVAAAGFGTSGEFVDSDWSEERSMLAVNCHATSFLAWHFAKKFVARGRGGLVLFGSLVGFQGTPFAAHYAATKAYVQTLAEGLHVELKPKGVDVLAVAPGPVHSGFAERARMVLGAADRPEAVARAAVRNLGSAMTVTPGTLGKILTWSLKTAPRSLRVHIMSKIMKGMTKAKDVDS